MLVANWKETYGYFLTIASVDLFSITSTFLSLNKCSHLSVGFLQLSQGFHRPLCYLWLYLLDMSLAHFSFSTWLELHTHICSKGVNTFARHRSPPRYRMSHTCIHIPWLCLIMTFQLAAEDSLVPHTAGRTLPSAVWAVKRVGGGRTDRMTDKPMARRAD